MDVERDLYKILNSFKVKASYYRLARVYHPDRVGAAQESIAKEKIIYLLCTWHFTIYLIALLNVSTLELQLTVRPIMTTFTICSKDNTDISECF